MIDKILQAASHIASLKAEAEADEEYLEKEARYLKSLGAESSARADALAQLVADN